jgi:HK97 family phage major capsid protein
MSVVPAIPGSDKRKALKEVRARKKALGDALAEVKKDRDAVKATVPYRPDGTHDTKSAEFQHLTGLIARVSELETEEKQAAEEERQCLTGMAGLPDAPAAASSGNGWNTGAFLGDPEVLARVHQYYTSSQQIGTAGLGELISQEALCAQFGWASRASSSAVMLDTSKPDVYASTVPPDAGRLAPWRGILPAPRRALRLLDLVPAAPAGNNLIPYTQEIPHDAAAETPEESLAPEADTTFLDVEARARTIEAYTKVRRQGLDDIPALQQVIQSRLQYSVNARLETQMVSGDGTGENITGILATTGIGDVAFSAGALPADQILAGMTTIYLSFWVPDAVAVHPLDWEAILAQKATGGDMQYYMGGPGLVTAETIWGLPLIPTVSVPQGKAVVGDWDMGAIIWVRQGVAAFLSDADQDDFLRRRITILAEGRFAAGVPYPAAFCVVNLK